MEDSILNKYLDEIGREALLSEEEERNLAQRIQTGDERALNKLVKANLRFVVAIASHYQGKGLSIDDLVSEGNMGLIKAARKFDSTRGLRFVNYAVVFIRQNIEKALDKESAQQRVEATQSGGIRSLDTPFNGRSNMSLLSVLINGNADGADEPAFNHNMENAVEKALLALNERETIVICAFFGIEKERQTMYEIAEDMGLKRERVRQIRDRAIRRLRKEYRQQMEALR